MEENQIYASADEGNASVSLVLFVSNSILSRAYKQILTAVLVQNLHIVVFCLHQPVSSV